MVKSDDIFKIIKDMERRIPSVADVIKEGLRYKSYEGYFIPLVKVEDLILDVTAIVRNNPEYKNAFVALLNRLYTVKRSMIAVLRLIMEPTIEHLEALLPKVK